MPSQTIYINNLNEKLKKDATKKSLYMIFSEFGKITEVNVSKANKLRGQAWVVFADVTSATNAIRRRQGFNFYGKPLKIAYSKSKSDSVARKDGTFVPRPKRTREETTSGASTAAHSADEKISSSQPPSKMQKLLVNNVPHRILFAQALPEDCTHETLRTLFSPYPGFQEVRMVPGKKDIAFIEFQEVVQAGIALQQLGGFKLNASDTLHLTYGNQ